MGEMEGEGPWMGLGRVKGLAVGAWSRVSQGVN